MRVFQGWTLCVLFSVVLFLGAGCSLGDDDDDSGNGDASGDTGQTEAGGGGQDGGGSLLQEVQDRGTLRCGVNDAVPGFGFTGEGGEPEGFDIDFCKVIAAAVLGDAEAVEYTPLSAEQRFTALQSGEIDVLSRNTTYTASRDGTEGARFLHTTFYDGQGMMVRTDSGTPDARGPGGRDDLRALRDDDRAQPRVAVPGARDRLHAARLRGQRAAPGGVRRGALRRVDLGQVAARRHPLGLARGPGRPRGARRSWTRPCRRSRSAPSCATATTPGRTRSTGPSYATIQAEEFGLDLGATSARASEDPEIQRFLGEAVEGEPFDAGLGLPDDFAVQVVTQVGNYAEIYDRNVGEGSALELPRDFNALWTDGGLQYAPPYR